MFVLRNVDVWTSIVVMLVYISSLSSFFLECLIGISHSTESCIKIKLIAILQVGVNKLGKKGTRAKSHFPSFYCKKERLEDKTNILLQYFFCQLTPTASIDALHRWELCRKPGDVII